MDNKPRKSTRVNRVPEQPESSREPPSEAPRPARTDDVDDAELDLDELEPRIAPRSIGTFF